MVFSSSFFLVYFLPIFLLLYYCSPRSFKNYTLLIFSILFYAWGAPLFIYLLLGSSAAVYYLVGLMHKTTHIFRKKVLLSLAVGVNVGMLVYFKYANFFIENFNHVLNSVGVEQIQWTKIILPIGISFYTFQSLTYAIDVYRNVHAPLRKLHEFVLYIIMFPQLIAGPIVRFNTIADQITRRDSSYDDRLIGMYIFVIGLAKKVLIANTMGQFADSVFGTDSLSQIDFSTMYANQIFLGILAYTFQIYFDFGGYSDMAIGIGKMIGFTFPENFKNPYTSKSITEFWRRWHITLGQWMKDYLYIPLGGNKVNSTLRLYANLWIVFLISGFWHGASWNFILWGAYHGLFLVLDRIFLKRILDAIPTVFSVAITFILVMFGWLLFRIEKLETIPQIISALVYNQWNFMPFADLSKVYTTLIVAAFFSFFVLFPFGEKIQNAIYYHKYGKINHLTMFGISVVLFVISLSFVTASGFNPFIYFRF